MNPAALALAALFIPAAAAAPQDPSPIARGLKVEALPIAYVLDDRGVETQGRLLNLDGDAVVLLVDGSERRFKIGGVRRVSRRGDSLKNGAIIGAVVGGAVGALAGGLSDCSGNDCTSWRATAFIMSSLFYSAIGVGIDALVQGRTVLYEASPNASVVYPGRGASVGVRVSW